jgi:hypothetical protein
MAGWMDEIVEFPELNTWGENCVHPELAQNFNERDGSELGKRYDIRGVSRLGERDKKFIKPPAGDMLAGPAYYQLIVNYFKVLRVKEFEQLIAETAWSWRRFIIFRMKGLCKLFEGRSGTAYFPQALTWGEVVNRCH